jgi:hypothetical protein
MNKIILSKDTRLLILGPLPIKSVILNRVLKKFTPTWIIFVDGGNKHKSKIKDITHYSILSIGDGDSSKQKQKKLDVKLPTQKNYSDLAFVVDVLIKNRKRITNVSFLGFSSHHFEERLDHLLFNLGLIQGLASKLCLPIYVDEYFLFLPAGKNVLKHKGIFSIISLRPNTIKLQGDIKYNLEAWTQIKAFDTHCLSNRSYGIFQIESKKEILVYLNQSVKF